MPGALIVAFIILADTPKTTINGRTWAVSNMAGRPRKLVRIIKQPSGSSETTALTSIPKARKTATVQRLSGSTTTNPTDHTTPIIDGERSNPGRDLLAALDAIAPASDVDFEALETVGVLPAPSTRLVRHLLGSWRRARLPATVSSIVET